VQPIVKNRRKEDSSNIGKLMVISLKNEERELKGERGTKEGREKEAVDQNKIGKLTGGIA